MSEEVRNSVVHHNDRDRLSSLSWALILIWAGLVFLADNIGLLRSFIIPGRGPFFNIFDNNVWAPIFLGAGVIVLIEVAIRLAVPAYATQSVSSSLIFAMIMFGMGLGSIFGWNIIWPLLLIGIGVSVLLGGILRPTR